MEALQFIAENIDSVPHLEALILLWNSRPVSWSLAELACRLYVTPERAHEILNNLMRLQVIREVEGPQPRFCYFARNSEQDALMQDVDSIYRKDLVRVSNMIHSKESSPVREFARAFRFRKDLET
ncbi:hypothetical protein [Terriglobus albidus]|uniref:hypothetical protein n=1 Tax=Terriglobus albidus TaxID=1592106 RepID=UPI0021DF8FF3|nr:hypothetical protein [Terriglobus albidus]